MDFSAKSETLAKKMNKLTSALSIADDLLVDGDDVIDFVQEKTQSGDVVVGSGSNNLDLISVENLITDFKFIRDTLHENTINGRRVLNLVTLNLLDKDDKQSATLITSFAELNKAVAENLKLYVTSYKEISTIMLNFEKIKNSKVPNSVINNQTINVEAPPISTHDLIKSLTKEK